MKKYTYDSGFAGLGALDPRQKMIVGGMVVALGAIGFIAYRANKKKKEEEAAAAAAAAAASSSTASSGGGAAGKRFVASKEVAEYMMSNRDGASGFSQRVDLRNY